MKKSISEIMKDIKELETRKNEVLQMENMECRLTYPKGEKPQKSDYSFLKTREAVSEINNEVRRLKALVTKANVETIVEGQEISLGSCLIYLAQLNYERNILDNMSRFRDFTQAIGPGGVIQYTQNEYSREELMSVLNEVNEKIKHLQLDIDRTNLTTMIDV